MTAIKSLEQIRAQHAWDFIEKNQNIIEKIAPIVRKLPAMIMTSGLGQTVAFCLSTSDYKRVIDDIANYLSKNTGVEGITCGSDLLNKIMNSNHETYIMLSQETLKYTTWLKRLIEAKLEE